MSASDVWDEAERLTVQEFDRNGWQVPITDWVGRMSVASRAGQTFAERYRQRGEVLGEADARRLVRELREVLDDGGKLNSATTLRECLLRAMDPQRKDRAENQKALDVALGRYMSDGRPIPAELRVWFECRDRRPKHSRDSQNFTRDSWIVGTLLKLQDCGIKPTRNETTARESGCAIVAELLDDMNERGVEKVWRERSRVL